MECVVLVWELASRCELYNDFLLMFVHSLERDHVQKALEFMTLILMLPLKFISHSISYIQEGNFQGFEKFLP